MHQHAECDRVAHNIIADQAVLRICILHMFMMIRNEEVASIMSAASKQENNDSGLSWVY